MKKALEEMFHVIEKKKVKCLVGYSSALGELSEYIRKTGRDCSRCVVKAIIPISGDNAGTGKKNSGKTVQLSGAGMVFQ